MHLLTFGTRLTNISRCLRERDFDIALRLADEQVHDWKGGTRIATALHEFNRVWASGCWLERGGAAGQRRLDRDDHGGLGAAAAQLQRMAHQLVWLSPCCCAMKFEPRAAGVRAILPHVDRFAGAQPREPR